MIDISKCSGSGCNQKESCYRYIAKPKKFGQSWIAPPIVREGESCPAYSKLREKNND